MLAVDRYKEFYKDDNLPSIKESICETPVEGKGKILNYLKKWEKGAVAPGKSFDIFTGEQIPGELCCYTDGEYVWRSDTIYYFEKYNLKLCDGLIKKIID